jgi:hypothetical protein
MKRQNKCHLAVVTFNDVPAINYSFKYNRLGLIAMENRQKYCERHGYDFISDVEISRDRPSCWAKIPALIEALELYEWVLWADSDAIIFDQTLGLEDLCDAGYDMVFQSHDEFYNFLGIPISKGLDRMPINTGVFLIRSSTWSRAFLERTYQQTQFVFSGEIWNGIGEQEAMISLLRQNPTDRLKIKYVQNLQNHPKFFGPGDRFVHFYGNHATHIIPLPECEEIFRRWTAASRGEGPLPVDIARFHWCSIQNIQPGGPVLCGDIHHYLYSPGEIIPGQAESDSRPLLGAGLR